MLDWQQEGGSDDHNDYLSSIKEDLFDEEVFVFTPKGDVLGLRKGATAVDFAYRIHSEVGNHCHGVRINDRLCPLATPLQNGDFVQVLTSKTAHPSLDWLNFVATPTARNRIRQWYKRSHRDETIERGKDLLVRELGRDGFDALGIDLRVELDGADQLSRTKDQIRSMADVIGIARVGTG